jgi:hypothetical protein
MTVGCVTVALAVRRFDQRVLERLVDRVSRVPDPESDPGFDRDLAALSRALEHGEVYLTPGLSIGELAKRLSLPEYRLRALINKRLGYQSITPFNQAFRDAMGCTPSAYRRQHAGPA